MLNKIRNFKKLLFSRATLISEVSFRSRIKFVLPEAVNANRNLLVTTYFCTRPDPQRGFVHRQDDYDYIKPWCESICRLNLQGVIFYDSLTEDFVTKYSNANIFFVKVPYFVELSTNDYRFFVYRQLLERWNGNSVFFTDGSDVIVSCNPFEFVKENLLFIGDDGEHTLGQNSWLHMVSERVGQEKYKIWLENSRDHRCFNAGILGGNFKIVQEFLRSLCFEFCLSKRLAVNKNMLLFNYIVDRKFRGRVSANLCSEYKKYQSSRTDVPFIHK